MLSILKKLAKANSQQVFCALRIELGPKKIREFIEKCMFY